MKQPIVKTEAMWAVYGTCGLYCRSNALTRRDAISAHLADLGSICWHERKLMGDRVIKVTIFPVK